jgi:hypothetical protein
MQAGPLLLKAGAQTADTALMHYAVAASRHSRSRPAIDQARAEGLAVYAMSDRDASKPPLLAWPWREQDVQTDVQRAAKDEYERQQALR